MEMPRDSWQTPNLIDAAKRVVSEILNHVPAFFSIIGPDFRYRLVCRSCEILFGRPRHEIEGRPVREMFGEEVFAKAEPLLKQALAGQAAGGEVHAVGADGKPHVLRIHLQPLRLAGAVDGIFAFAYDVTELRQTEAELRQSESRMKVLVEHNPDLITIVDRDHIVRFINHTEPDPQTKPEDVVGINVIMLSPPEYHDWLRERYDYVWRTGKPVDLEVPIVWRGQTRWFSSRLVTLPNGDQPPAELLIVSRETTQRVEMEQALRESELRFRQFAEVLDDVVWIHDAKPEKVVFVNESFERVWGVPRKTLYENPLVWIAAIHVDDRPRVSLLWKNVLEGTSLSFDVEYRIVRPDGAVRWIHDYGVAIRGPDGKPLRLTGIARDVTARKAAEEEREVFQKQLLQTQKLESLGVLAGGIAHDFNNLLAGILGNVNLAQNDASGPSVGPSLHSYLEQIETISLRAGDLCKQMLAYAGKGQIAIAALDINSLVEEIAHLLSISISKKATLQIQRGADLPAIRGDASQLRQVLLNLVINASEALGDRTGIIRVSTGQTDMTGDDLYGFQFGSELTPGPYVFVEVSDNGPGMPPEVLSRIFEPFFTTKFTGRGLGLAAVQGIVRSHGGAIRVTSKIGKGTAFTLLLPPAVDETPAPSIEVGAGVPLQAHGVALVVDDEKIVNASVALMMESFGFDVLTAANGREAIEIFARRHGDIRVILLDLTMPVVSGEEAFHELRRIDPNVPILFMSGYMEQEIADRFADGTVAGFLQKPFRMETLEQTLAKVTKH